MTEAYLVHGIRTPIGRVGGSLATIRADDMAAHSLRQLVDDLPSVDWERVDDVYLGCANQAGEDNRNVARMAGLLAGLPVSVPGATVNRLCASGLEAVTLAARTIQAGQANLVIAGGVENMTRAPFVISKPAAAWGRNAEIHDTTIGWRFVDPRMAEAFGTDSMPETAQKVAESHGNSREDQDAFAVRSHERAALARANGRLNTEIAPVRIRGRQGETLVEHDEHPRKKSLEALGRLRPIVAGGSITAGNSSGINDGSVPVLVASTSAVERYGLRPLAKVTGGASVGVEPRLMGLEPLPATTKLLERHGLAIADVDVLELNEAFASQALAVLRGLGIPDDAEYVNPNGGAIALGHPLGASGARLALTAAHELALRNGRYAVVAMCVGVGQETAVLLESAS